MIDHIPNYISARRLRQHAIIYHLLSE